MLILAYRILPEQLCLILCEFSVTIPDFPLCIDPGWATSLKIQCEKGICNDTRITGGTSSLLLSR